VQGCAWLFKTRRSVLLGQDNGKLINVANSFWVLFNQCFAAKEIKDVRALHLELTHH
jgi:hypothetical protein